MLQIMSCDTTNYTACFSFQVQVCRLVHFTSLYLMQIGLAVGDIEGVQKNARLKRLATQVELTADMEKKLPSWIIEKVNKQSVTEQPNKPCAAVTRVCT